MANNNSGVVDIRGKQYKTVALRVSEFREMGELTDGWGLLTSIVSRDESGVCVRAEVTYKGDTVATGHAEETRTGSINKFAALENCETSAIGRALAAAGFAGSEFASADELAVKLDRYGHAGYFNTLVNDAEALATKKAIQTRERDVDGMDLSPKERCKCKEWLRGRWMDLDNQEKELKRGTKSGNTTGRSGADSDRGDGTPVSGESDQGAEVANAAG